MKTLEYQRARRLKNKEMHRAASAKYQKKLLFKIKNGEADPAWLKKRRDGKNMNAKKCYIVHREKILEKNKKYYDENKIKIKLRRIELEIEREEKAKND